MSKLNQMSKGKKIENKVLLIGEQARLAKSKNNEVINATVGMLYQDKLYKFNSVDNIKLTNEEKYSYSKTMGNDLFNEMLLNWLFMDYFKQMSSNLNIAINPTAGGTGAISNAFSAYTSNETSIYLPNIMWSVYQNLANTYQTYDLYSLDELISKIELDPKEKIFIIINDPLQNPTGHSFSYHEYELFIDKLNKINKTIILLHDLAYIDFDPRGLNYTRRNLSLYTKINNNILILLAFSGSKSFSLYGLRIGALIALSKELNDISEFNEVMEFYSRTKWSNPTQMGLSLITKTLQFNLDMFKVELDQATKLLASRSKLLTSYLDEFKIKYLKHSGGFFITINATDPYKSYLELVSKNVYLIPLKNHLRIAICSINEEEIKRLVYILKEINL